jgi:hypothetical protein
MNAQSVVVIKVEKNDHTYAFHMPFGVQYGEAYDAAFSILEDILELSKQSLETSRRKEKEEQENK